MRNLVLILALIASTEADPRALAKTAAEHGARDYQIGDYAAALTSFEEAYRLFPAPKLLFNIGQCHRYLGQFDKAIWAFESYLQAAPEAPERAHVEGLIAKSRVEQKTLQAQQERNAEEERSAELEAATKRAAEAEVARQADERARADAERDKARLAQLATTQREAEPAVYETWWFWTIVTGTVLAAAGTVAVVSASADPELILPMGGLGTVDHRTP